MLTNIDRYRVDVREGVGARTARIHGIAATVIDMHSRTGIDRNRVAKGVDGMVGIVGLAGGRFPVVVWDGSGEIGIAHRDPHQPGVAGVTPTGDPAGL